MNALLKYNNIHDNPDSLNDSEFAFHVELLHFIKRKEGEANEVK